VDLAGRDGFDRVRPSAHCSAGDVLIAATALVLSLGIVGTREWPARHFARVAVVASVIGIGYTVFSEWMNVHVHNTWAYSQPMPVISLGRVTVGLSPMLQWCIVPPASFVFVKCFVHHASLIWVKGTAPRAALKFVLDP